MFRAKYVQSRLLQNCRTRERITIYITAYWHWQRIFHHVIHIPLSDQKRQLWTVIGKYNFNSLGTTTTSDVLRLRSVIGRVMVFCHQVILVCLMSTEKNHRKPSSMILLPLKPNIGLAFIYEPSAKADPGRHIPSQGDICIEFWFLKQKIHSRWTVSVRVSLRGMLRLIWVTTLRRVHSVGFLVGWLTVCSVTCY